MFTEHGGGGLLDTRSTICSRTGSHIPSPPPNHQPTISVCSLLDVKSFSGEHQWGEVGSYGGGVVGGLVMWGALLDLLARPAESGFIFGEGDIRVFGVHLTARRLAGRFRGYGAVQTHWMPHGARLTLGLRWGQCY